MRYHDATPTRTRRHASPFLIFSVRKSCILQVLGVAASGHLMGTGIRAAALKREKRRCRSLRISSLAHTKRSLKMSMQTLLCVRNTNPSLFCGDRRNVIQRHHHDTSHGACSGWLLSLLFAWKRHLDSCPSHARGR